MNIAKIVREAREQSRLTALDFANGIFDEFIELHGDRSFRDDGAVIGGIGWLGDQAVTVVGIQKGKSLHDNLKRNFGQPHPEGFASILWKDGSRAMEAAELMKITSHELLEMGIVDKVISETGLSSKELQAHVKNELRAELDRLGGLALEQLLEERYQRFRKY